MDETIEKALERERGDPNLAAMRLETSHFVAETFATIGTLLEVSGHIVGEDRKSGASPFGFGNDEVYGMSLVLRISEQLIKTSADLLTNGNAYAGAALLRQIVELEYLAWAFDKRQKDAETWLRSDKKRRQDLFRPARLRDAASGEFRGKDYGYHCELGGHPTPQAITLLSNDKMTVQLLMSDLIGHAEGIWGHFVGWAKQHEELSELFKSINQRATETGTKFQAWKSYDPLIGLPPPP